MNKEKAKILLKLYKEDLITVDEFILLAEEERVYLYSSYPNYNLPIYTGTGTNTPKYDSITNPNIASYNSGNNIFQNNDQKTTISNHLHKAFFDPEKQINGI